MAGDMRAMVLYEEPIRRYLLRRYSLLIPACIGVGVVAVLLLLAIGLWAGVINWGPRWRINSETLALVGVVGVASVLVFVLLIITEGLAVQRAFISNDLIVVGKRQALFKRLGKPHTVEVARIRRMELREGIPIPTLPFFRKIRLWRVRLVFDDSNELEVRRFDPGFADESAWKALKALGDILQRRGVDVTEIAVSAEVP